MQAAGVEGVTGGGEVSPPVVSAEVLFEVERAVSEADDVEALEETSVDEERLTGLLQSAGVPVDAVSTQSAGVKAAAPPPPPAQPEARPSLLTQQVPPPPGTPAAGAGGGEEEGGEGEGEGAGLLPAETLEMAGAAGALVLLLCLMVAYRRCCAPRARPCPEDGPCPPRACTPKAPPARTPTRPSAPPLPKVAGGESATLSQVSLDVVTVGFA